MRHRSNDLFSCPGTFETKSLGSRQISAKGCGVKGSIRNVLWNRNRESHFLSLQELKRLSRHHLSHDETLQWARHQAIGENDKLIKNSCHDALFAAQHCENTGRRDRERFHHQHAQRCCVPLPSDGPERCRSRSGRQDRYRNIEWLEFGVQRFAEEEHVTFACGVSSIARYCLIAKKACSQKDMTRPALFHIGCKYVRELRERHQVDLQHLESLLKRLIYKFSVKTVTGVVQKNVDGDIESIQTRFQFCCSAGHGKISPFDHDIHTMPLAKLFS